MHITTKGKLALIRDLNDRFRTTFCGGRVMMSAGVAALPPDMQVRVLTAVQSFKDFSADNDPHGEHDCATFEAEGERYLWKLDYYDRECRYGSEAPEDAGRTIRVLTVMRADEY